MDDEDGCYLDQGDLIHVFEVPTGIEMPREAPCVCGDVTWGEMDDLLILTKMWETTPKTV